MRETLLNIWIGPLFHIAFHMRCLRRILGVKWDDFMTNNAVLEKCGMQTIYCLLSVRRLRWLGHASRMLDGRIPKDILYGELAEGKRSKGRPLLRYKDVCKRDMKAGGLDLEDMMKDRDSWRQTVKTCTSNAEEKRLRDAEEKRTKRKEAQSNTLASTTNEPPLSSYICPYCRQEFRVQTALYSHLRTHHRFCVDWSSNSSS